MRRPCTSIAFQVDFSFKEEQVSDLKYVFGQYGNSLDPQNVFYYLGLYLIKANEGKEEYKDLFRYMKDWVEKNYERKDFLNSIERAQNKKYIGRVNTFEKMQELWPEFCAGAFDELGSHSQKVHAEPVYQKQNYVFFEKKAPATQTQEERIDALFKEKKGDVNGVFTSIHGLRMKKFI
jgi:restriction endonuclease